MRKASRHPTLSSMANSGCLLLSGSGMLPHSLQCPPAFLYLPEVRLNDARFVDPRSLSSPSLCIPFRLSVRSLAARDGIALALCCYSEYFHPPNPWPSACLWGVERGGQEAEVERGSPPLILPSEPSRSSSPPVFLFSLQCLPFFEWN